MDLPANVNHWITKNILSTCSSGGIHTIKDIMRSCGPHIPSEFSDTIEYLEKVGVIKKLRNVNSRGKVETVYLKFGSKEKFAEILTAVKNAPMSTIEGQ